MTKWNKAVEMQVSYIHL